MSAIQFSGLASGLDSTSIINQLMTVEAAPQNALKSRLATAQSQASALQQVNTSLASLSDSAKSFTTGSTWTQLAAKSSSSAVTVTASSTALASSFSLTVQQVATTARTTVGAAALAGAPGTTFTLTGADGTPTSIDSAGSLSGLASAINATTKTSGVQAQLVHSTAGDVLMLNSTGTGTAASFTLANGDGSTFAAGTGTNARVSLGSGVEVESSSNTFTNLMTGIDVTLTGDATAGTGAGTPATTASISVAADGASRSNAMQAFVGQINGVLSQLRSTSAYGTIAAGKAAAGGGVLPGDPTLRSVIDQLVTTIYPADKTSMAAYGISVDRSGQLTFDSTAFKAAYEADPDKVQAAFTGAGGFAARIKQVADGASDPHDGAISQYIKSGGTLIDRYQREISSWDDRLAMKQASLQHIYTNLETRLSKLSAQQSWLSSQLDSLDGGWAQNSK